MKKLLKSKFPEAKKTINAFLVGEEGKISKQSIIKAGVIMGAVTLGAVKGVSAGTSHQNNVGDLGLQGTMVSTSHGHHTSHSSHSSHSSY